MSCRGSLLLLDFTRMKQSWNTLCRLTQLEWKINCNIEKENYLWLSVLICDSLICNKMIHVETFQSYIAFLTVKIIYTGLFSPVAGWQGTINFGRLGSLNFWQNSEYASTREGRMDHILRYKGEHVRAYINLGLPLNAILTQEDTVSC